MILLAASWDLKSRPWQPAARRSTPAAFFGNLRLDRAAVRMLQAGLLIAIVCCGCRRNEHPEVVVYAALDSEFSQPILKQFEAARGVQVRANFDVESTKTVGLVNRILAEQQRPRCDVFWNNEILHTLRLQQLGLLESYHSPAGQALPASYRGADGTWYGFAARARVLIVNHELVPLEQMPGSVADLVDPRWQNQVGIAKPLFGTTATHAAVLFTLWGEPRATEFFSQLKANAQVLSGNKQVALAVAQGQLAFGLTDTDDAIIEQQAGRPVSIVFPDQEPDQPGTLFIPNTLCILKGGPNPAQARQLVDYLLRPEVEGLLAEGPSAQFPVNPDVSERSIVQPTGQVRWMDVDFEQAARDWNAASQVLRDMFAAAQ